MEVAVPVPEGLEITDIYSCETEHVWLDENKLRNIMSSPVTDSNINEYGRFDELLKTINLVKSKNTLEKIYNKRFAGGSDIIRSKKIIKTCFYK